MPAIQPLQTAIGAHPNHDAIATAKIICRPPGANSPKYGILARHNKLQTVIRANQDRLQISTPTDGNPIAKAFFRLPLLPDILETLGESTPLLQATNLAK
jgi:hypothetical protein